MYPYPLMMVLMERVKFFHDFHYWKFKHASVVLEVFAISTHKSIAFQQLQGGLCNEFDSSSFELKVFGSVSSVLPILMCQHNV